MNLSAQEIRQLCKPGDRYTGDATNAPAWAQKKIAELRSDNLATGKPFPGARSDDKTYYGAYRSTLVVATGTGRFKPTEQEQRSDAARAINRGTPSLVEAILFGTERRRQNTELQEVRRLSKATGLDFKSCHIALCCQRQGGKPAIDTLHRMKLVADEKRIARAAELQREEKQRALLSDMSANATEQLKIQLDVKCGLRPAEPGALKYGFTDLRSDYGCGPSDAGFNGRPRMESQGQEQDPTVSLRYADGETAATEKEHNRAATGHRCIAGRCSMNRGAKHLEAADRHQVAVREPSPVNTQKAQESSRRANEMGVPPALPGRHAKFDRYGRPPKKLLA
jgi:hypothetical protein